jgi:hypothetical protein
VSKTGAKDDDGETSQRCYQQRRFNRPDHQMIAPSECSCRGHGVAALPSLVVILSVFRELPVNPAAAVMAAPDLPEINRPVMDRLGMTTVQRRQPGAHSGFGLSKIQRGWVL